MTGTTSAALKGIPFGGLIREDAMQKVIDVLDIDTVLIPSIGSSKVTQSYSKVTAPYDAWVLETSAQTGDLAMPGKPLMTVYAPQPLRVVVQWPASQKNALPKLNDIQIQSGTETIKPVAMQIMPNADGISQTIGIKLDLPRTGAAVNASPGQQVQVRIAGAAQAKGLVPKSAILRRGEITAVYVAQENGFAMKLVRLGADHGIAGVEVWAGLKEGDLILPNWNKARLAKYEKTDFYIVSEDDVVLIFEE